MGSTRGTNKSTLPWQKRGMWRKLISLSAWCKKRHRYEWWSVRVRNIRGQSELRYHACVLIWFRLTQAHRKTITSLLLTYFKKTSISFEWGEGRLCTKPYENIHHSETRSSRFDLFYAWPPTGHLTGAELFNNRSHTWSNIPHLGLSPPRILLTHVELRAFQGI